MFAAIVIATLVAGATWFKWAELPSGGQSLIRADATIVSITTQFPTGKSGARASIVVVMQKDDGAQIGFDRAMGCAPTAKVGDRVKAIGRLTNAGGINWGIVGEPCAT